MSLDFLWIDDPGECWEWYGGKTPKGYATGYFDGKTQYVHRFAYQLVYGPIPDGMTIDHLCNNPGCGNPSHMKVATQQENNLRGNSWAAVNARKDSCPKCGGEYESERDGRRRFCRPCRNERAREYYHAHRDA